jgi:hypothetical protein
MTDDEVEIVAQLLARVGGSWYPEQRTRPALRPVMTRHRDVARLVLSAIARDKADSDSSGASAFNFADDDQLYVGATVVYRPPGEKRAITCRIAKMDHGRAYLAPASQEIGWVPVQSLRPLKP